MWLNKLINSITRRRAVFMVLFLVMIIIGVSCFNSVSDDKAKRSGSGSSLAGMGTSVTGSKPAEVRLIPESFSALAEMASPAVVNIRTVRTGKTGNIFRQFHKGPFGEDDQMEDFFNKFFPVISFLFIELTYTN